MTVEVSPAAMAEDAATRCAMHESTSPPPSPNDSPLPITDTATATGNQSQIEGVISSTPAERPTVVTPPPPEPSLGRQRASSFAQQLLEDLNDEDDDSMDESACDDIDPNRRRVSENVSSRHQQVDNHDSLDLFKHDADDAFDHYAGDSLDLKDSQHLDVKHDEDASGESNDAEESLAAMAARLNAERQKDSKRLLEEWQRVEEVNLERLTMRSAKAEELLDAKDGESSDSDFLDFCVDARMHTYRSPNGTSVHMVAEDDDDELEPSIELPAGREMPNLMDPQIGTIDRIKTESNIDENGSANNAATELVSKTFPEPVTEADANASQSKVSETPTAETGQELIALTAKAKNTSRTEAADTPSEASSRAVSESEADTGVHETESEANNAWRRKSQLPQLPEVCSLITLLT